MPPRPPLRANRSPLTADAAGAAVMGSLHHSTAKNLHHYGYVSCARTRFTESCAVGGVSIPVRDMINGRYVSLKLAGAFRGVMVVRKRILSHQLTVIDQKGRCLETWVRSAREVRLSFGPLSFRVYQRYLFSKTYVMMGQL